MGKFIPFFIVLGICLIFLPQSFADLDDGLEAYYPFNGNADDVTSNGYNGTVLGDTSPTEDRFGNADSAYSFDGYGDYIKIGQQPDFPSWHTYAVSVWFLNNGGGDDTSGYGQKIIDKTIWYNDENCGRKLNFYLVEYEPPYTSWIWLGNISPISVSVGWDQYRVDESWYQSGFDIAGVHYDHGIFTHPSMFDPAHVIYNLNAHYSAFSACIGLEDGDGDCGDGVVFRVAADGIEIFSSDVITSAQPVTCFNVPLNSCMALELFVDPLGDYFCDEAVRANAKLITANQPPEATCQDVTVSTERGTCISDASIDNGSFDPDGDEITLEQTPTGPYDLGDTDLILTVTDEKGASDTCEATVKVIDEEDPVIFSVTANQNKLWPPNHKMVPVTVTVDAKDNCSRSMLSALYPSTRQHAIFAAKLPKPSTYQFY